MYVKEAVKVYTDGACYPNPGMGACCAIVMSGNYGKIYTRKESSSTSNRAEMLAIILGISKAKLSSNYIDVYSDSEYAINSFSKWMHKWQKYGWVRGHGKRRATLKNLDLIKEYYELQQGLTIVYHWVKGHSGHQFNEVCDHVANGLLPQLPYGSRIKEQKREWYRSKRATSGIPYVPQKRISYHFIEKADAALIRSHIRDICL